MAYGGVAVFSRLPRLREDVLAQADRMVWILTKPRRVSAPPRPANGAFCLFSEPPEIKKYPRSYLAQFGTVVSPYISQCQRRNMVIGNPCLNWHFGVSCADGRYSSKFGTLDELRRLPVPQKTGLVSVICSNKTATEAQRARLGLVSLLRSIWAMCCTSTVGFNPVDDKMSAIAPYKYHVVLENNLLPPFLDRKAIGRMAWLVARSILARPTLARSAPQLDLCP